jgi:hypothetical protein
VSREGEEDFVEHDFELMVWLAVMLGLAGL